MQFQKCLAMAAAVLLLGIELYSCLSLLQPLNGNENIISTFHALQTY